MSTIEMHATTDVGIKRNHNEDCVGITPEVGFAVLADGMGGHNAGEVASAMAASQGIEVYNLSINSRLPDTVIPKISLEDALGMT